jgi:type IX secretion system PorP/SprF family membrane protein
MRNKILFSLLALAMASTAYAQQTSTSDHYLVQQYLVNPAAAGLNGTSAFLEYRKQWVGFSGAPETQVLAIDGAIKKENIGLGLMLVNDQVNFLGSTEVMSSFAYRIKLDEKHFLRFGLSAGVNQNRILFDKIVSEDATEVQVFQSNQNATSFDGAAGLFYELGELKAGIAASHLFNEKYYYENNFNENSLKFQNIRHYLANAQYRINFSQGKWAVMPSVQVRAAQGLSPLVEGGVSGFYKNNAWLTLRYAKAVGYTVAIGGVIAKNIVAGYSYTLSAKGLDSYNQGTHDILLGFRFASKNAGKDAEQKALEELQKKNNELFEKTDYLKAENELLKKELQDQKRILKESIYGLDSIKKKMMDNLPELNKIIKENQEKLDKMQDENGNGDGASNDSKDGKKSGNKSGKGDKQLDTKKLFSTASENTKTVTKEEIASSTQEANPGKIYVVIGATKTLAVAKQYQQIINREYGEETKIVRSDTDSWFFIYTKSFDNKEDASIEKERAIKMDSKGILVGNPWRFITTK